jgi:hypothetical protein
MFHLLLSKPQKDTSSDRTAPLKPKDGLNGPPVGSFSATSEVAPFQNIGLILADLTLADLTLADLTLADPW